MSLVVFLRPRLLELKRHRTFSHSIVRTKATSVSLDLVGFLSVRPLDIKDHEGNVRKF